MGGVPTILYSTLVVCIIDRPRKTRADMEIRMFCGRVVQAPSPPFADDKRKTLLFHRFIKTNDSMYEELSQNRTFGTIPREDLILYRYHTYFKKRLI